MVRYNNSPCGLPRVAKDCSIAQRVDRRIDQEQPMVFAHQAPTACLGYGRGEREQIAQANDVEIWRCCIAAVDVGWDWFMLSIRTTQERGQYRGYTSKPNELPVPK